MSLTGNISPGKTLVGKINVSPGVTMTGRISELDILLISAYGVAVKNGFEGTEEEWLASLKGEKGYPGYTPVKGQDYTDGTSFLYYPSSIISSDDSIVGISEIKRPSGRLPQIGDLVLCFNGDVARIEAIGSFSEEPEEPEVILNNTGLSLKGIRGEKGDKGDTGAQGEKGADGYTPVKGDDYWTEVDKAEMISAVISALPVYNGEVVEV